jgi:hypothetical protein
MAALLAEQARSGLSLAEFARRRGMPAARLRWWKREIQQRAKARGRRRGRLSENRPQLVPLSIALDGPIVVSDFVLELPTGARLRIPPGSSPEHLRQILTVLWPSC